MITASPASTTESAVPHAAPSRLANVLWAMLGICLMQAAAAPLIAAEGGGEKGISYKHDRIASVPWSVHVVKIPRNEPTLEVRSTLAKGTVLGLSLLSEQALNIPASAGTPLAGVNGDFYEREGSRYAGDPRGLQIVEGDLVSEPTGNSSYCAFWIDMDGNPHIDDVVPQFKATLPDGKSFKLGLNEERRAGDVVLYTPALGRATRTTGGREVILEKTVQGAWTPFRAGEDYVAKVREVSETGNTKLDKSIAVLSFGPRRLPDLPVIEPGQEIKISTATTPSLRTARTAISGGSIITRGGKKAKIERPATGGLVSSYSVSSMFERHPRAAVGFSKTHIYLVEVDGRQRGLSAGMTLEELGEYMAKAGCEEAINLDGGGSATFWYRGRVVNSPCDGTERTVANGLVVIRKPATAASK